MHLQNSGVDPTPECLDRQGECELLKVKVFACCVNHPSPVSNEGLGVEQALNEYLWNPNGRDSWRKGWMLSDVTARLGLFLMVVRVRVLEPGSVGSNPTSIPSWPCDLRRWCQQSVPQFLIDGDN